MALSDLEKQKCKNFPEKHNADVHANIKQKPCGASLRGHITIPHG